MLGLNQEAIFFNNSPIIFIMKSQYIAKFHATFVSSKRRTIWPTSEGRFTSLSLFMTVPSSPVDVMKEW